LKLAASRRRPALEREPLRDLLFDLRDVTIGVRLHEGAGLEGVLPLRLRKARENLGIPYLIMNSNYLQ
jgi:hypothetical protein